MEGWLDHRYAKEGSRLTIIRISHVYFTCAGSSWMQVRLHESQLNSKLTFHYIVVYFHIRITVFSKQRNSLHNSSLISFTDDHRSGAGQLQGMHVFINVELNSFTQASNILLDTK